MKRFGFMLILTLSLIVTGCGPKNVCQVQAPAATTVAITASTLAVLDAQGLLPPEVKAEVDRFMPCAEKFLSDLEAYCDPVQAEVVAKSALMIKSSRENSLCTAANVVSTAMLVLDGVVWMLPSLPPEVVAFYQTFTTCGDSLVASLRVHGGC